jgi:hypothetical protein
MMACNALEQSLAVRDHGEKEREVSPMTDLEWIKAAIDNDRAALIDRIKHMFDCREAEIDSEAGIWIADPQEGHWLDTDGVARLARALKAGDISRLGAKRRKQHVRSRWSKEKGAGGVKSTVSMTARSDLPYQGR